MYITNIALTQVCNCAAPYIAIRVHVNGNNMEWLVYTGNSADVHCWM